MFAIISRIAAAAALVFLAFPVMVAGQSVALGGHREIRAVWFTTVGGLDWPDGYASDSAGAERQKRQLCAHFDRLKAMGINTVLFQTRVRGTVLYPSAFEPWDGCLSGTPGKSPGYDALRFAVEQCHRRGMDIQAWVVAFPLASHRVMRQLGKASLARRRPGLCLKTGGNWMMNPGVPATGDYLAELCAEIARNYDVDGIHLDYIRYPEKEVPFNDSRTYRKWGGGKRRAEWRRDNVTACVRKIYKAVKAVKPWVAVSCAPVGKHDDLPRSHSYGWNARSAVAQDAQRWMAEGIMDQIFPMMYFRGKHFYPFALDWLENSGGRTVAPGLGAYFLDKSQKDWELEVVTREMNFLRACGAGGQAFFRSEFLEKDVKGIATYLGGTFYTAPALAPPMVWADSISPAAPGGVGVRKARYEWSVEWDAATDPTPGDMLRYNIYASQSYPVCPDSSRMIATRLKDRKFTIDVACPASRRLFYAVTAIDRFGNESPASGINRPVAAEKAPKADYEIADGRLRLDNSDARLVIIHDEFGRELRVVDYRREIDVSMLSPGVYKAYSLGRKGKPHLARRFAISPQAQTEK